MRSETPSVDRRTVVRVTGAALAGASLTGCSGGSGSGGSGSGGGGSGSSESGSDSGASSGGGGSGDSGGESGDFDGWMENVGNYNSVAGKTGQDEVTVTVGTEGNGGAFAFAPAAVRVAAGTTVVWEWTGEGSPHNVVAEDGSFESEMKSEEGATFEHTFESGGTYKYACTPHETMGMKGVVVVE